MRGMGAMQWELNNASWFTIIVTHSLTTHSLTHSRGRFSECLITTDTSVYGMSQPRVSVRMFVCWVTTKAMGSTKDSPNSCS